MFGLPASGQLIVKSERIGYHEEIMDRRGLVAEPMEGEWTFEFTL